MNNIDQLRDALHIAMKNEDPEEILDVSRRLDDAIVNFYQLRSIRDLHPAIADDKRKEKV